MWFWEVLYEDSNGLHSIFSLRGYDTIEQAIAFFDAQELKIVERIRERSGELVDIQIVYKPKGDLYDDYEEI